MKIFFRVTLGICIVLIVLIFWRYTKETEIETVYNANTTEPLGEEILEDDSAVRIAVKGIVLTQGESGLESWRLNATSASVDQESGLVSVISPRITYFFKDQPKNLYIDSEKGAVQQSKNIVTLTGKVKVVQDDNLLLTNKAVYDGNSRVLNLPEALEFFNPMFTGSASTAAWNVDSNVLTATDQVNVKILSKKKSKK